MDTILEHFFYKNVPITICMKDLKPIEQYEVIRLLLASKNKDIKIFTHEATNDYITQLLKELPVVFVQCFVEKEQEVVQAFEQMLQAQVQQQEPKTQ